jgi:hypothetical protein
MISIINDELGLHTDLCGNMEKANINLNFSSVLIVVITLVSQTTWVQGNKGVMVVTFVSLSKSMKQL